MLFLIAMGVVLESEDRRSHVVNYEDFLQQTYSIVQPNIISGFFYSELNYEVPSPFGQPLVSHSPSTGWCLHFICEHRLNPSMLYHPRLHRCYTFVSRCFMVVSNMCVYFTFTYDDDQQWLSYFSNGLKPPTPRFDCCLSLVISTFTSIPRLR